MGNETSRNEEKTSSSTKSVNEDDNKSFVVEVISVKSPRKSDANEEKKKKKKNESGESTAKLRTGIERQPSVSDLQPDEAADGVGRPAAEKIIKSESLKEYQTSPTGYKHKEDVFKKLQLKIKLPIGRGSYGTVVKLTKPDGTDVVAKIIDLKKSRHRAKENDRLKQNALLMLKIKHKYLVNVLDSFIIDKTLYILMDYYKHSMVGEISKNKGLPQETCRRYFAQIISVFKYMHQMNIAHRDFKLHNIFLTTASDHRFKDVRISDFCLAKAPFKKKNGVIELMPETKSIRFFAPEILAIDRKAPKLITEDLKYDYLLADIWSLGVCLFVMLTDQLPFDPFDFDAMLQQQRLRRFVIPPNIASNDRLVDLLNGLLQPEPKKRLKMRQVVAHPWLRDEVKLFIQT